MPTQTTDMPPACRFCYASAQELRLPAEDTCPGRLMTMRLTLRLSCGLFVYASRKDCTNNVVVCNDFMRCPG